MLNLIGSFYTMPRKYFFRLSRIDMLIRLKSTGKPSDFAEKLEISESTLYDFIALMRELGAPIKWNSEKNSYVYDPEGKMEIKFSSKEK